MPRKKEEIIVGVSLDARGVVHLAEGLQEPLCDAAIALQKDGRPVDVEHVVAALVMAARDGKLSSDARLDQLSADQMSVLARYVEILFQQHGGRVSDE